MKRMLVAAGLIVLLLSATTTSAEVQALQTEITAVTLYADRALVTRTGTTPLKAGISQVTIGRLPAWIDTGSIRAELSPRAAAEIVEIQVSKEFQAEPDNEALRAAEAALHEIDDQLAQLQDELALLEARRKQVESLATFNMEKLPRDAVTRDIPVTTYKDLVAFVSEERTGVVERSRAIARQTRELKPEREARTKRLTELKKLARLEHASIALSVQAPAAADVELTVRYMTPGATWEPVHEMRVDAGNHVRFLSFARVSQTTGEHWNGATITVSTQSPGKALNIPKLDALLVGNTLARPLPQMGINANDTFAAANKDFIGNNAWMNVANGIIVGGKAQQTYAKNWAVQQQQQEKSILTFERLQKRGTTAMFEALEQKSVRSDGTAVRLPIGTQSLESTPLLVAAPEITLNTTRTLNLANTGSQPILPGSVALYIDGAFIGTTSVEFVGTGEEFSMFAGLVDEVKIERILDHKKSRLTRGRRTNKMVASFVTTVANLSDQPVTIKLIDRVPVSDDREIKVTGVSLEPKIEPGDDGLLDWELSLQPKTEQRILVSYTVHYPAEIAARQQRGVPSSSFDAAEQIINLEAKF